MMIHNVIKPAILAVLIMVGLALRYGPAQASETQRLFVAGGCFWCVEADFEKVTGVLGVVSGYTGGTSENPTYKEVTRGGTGHYEAVEIAFDPTKVSRATLVDLFLRSVDPTDAGGQFCDRGDSYRTAIFVSNIGEKRLAEAAIAKAEQALGQEIQTPVLDLGPFWPAEDYHQDYYKGSKLVFTRFGPKRQSSAYKAYRDACGRDQRVKELWGDKAAFVGG